TGLATLPFAVAVNVIGTPARGLPLASTSFTAGAVGSAERSWPVCASPRTTASAAYVVTHSVTGLSFTHGTIVALSAFTTGAVSTFAPAVAPNVHCTAARPFAPVLTTDDETVPPPVVENRTSASAVAPPARFVTTMRTESPKTAPGVTALGAVK